MEQKPFDPIWLSPDTFRDVRNSWQTENKPYEDICARRQVSSLVVLQLLFVLISRVSPSCVKSFCIKLKAKFDRIK